MHSKIQLIQLTQEWTGAKLLNIPNYRMVSVKSSDAFLCNHVWLLGWYCSVMDLPPPTTFWLQMHQTSRRSLAVLPLSVNTVFSDQLNFYQQQVGASH
jgi:hypothetical protein